MQVHQGVDQEPACFCHAARYLVHDPQPTAHRQAPCRQLRWPGFQNVCKKVLKVPVRVCSTHVSAIPANNGTFKKRFKSQEVYKRFYELLVRLKDCSYEAARGRSQVARLLVQLAGGSG